MRQRRLTKPRRRASRRTWSPIGGPDRIELDTACVIAHSHLTGHETNCVPGIQQWRPPASRCREPCVATANAARAGDRVSGRLSERWLQAQRAQVADLWPQPEGVGHEGGHEVAKRLRAEIAAGTTLLERRCRSTLDSARDN